MPWTSKGLVQLYKNTDSGYFFSPSTMRFWRSRVLSHFRRLDGNHALFITSEKAGFDDLTRKFTIRLAKIIQEENGHERVQIDTLSQFGEFRSSASAKTVMRAIKPEFVIKEGDSQ